MTTKPWNLGIFGCGDFLRWQSADIKKSQLVTVAALYDPDRARAEHYAADLGGRAVPDGEAIFADPAIDAVCLFVPPWLRRAMFERALAAGKHILATKPLCASAADAAAMADMVRAAAGKVRCGVFYSRTGDAWAEAARALFAGGEYGRLALYRQDWIHHYPTWNTWALDPEKNGGPFMDAMIHNLNCARYLMGRPLRAATWFSDRLAHPDLPCADTEMVKADFADAGAAYLMITWAADLEVFNNDGNNRDHIDMFYMVTDRGWYVTKDRRDGRTDLRLTRDGQVVHVAAPPLPATPYDRFAAATAAGAPNPPDVPTAEMAAFDITLLRQLSAQPFNRLARISATGAAEIA